MRYSDFLMVLKIYGYLWIAIGQKYVASFLSKMFMSTLPLNYRIASFNFSYKTPLSERDIYRLSVDTTNNIMKFLQTMLRVSCKVIFKIIIFFLLAHRHVKYLDSWFFKTFLWNSLNNLFEAYVTSPSKYLYMFS